MRSDLHLRWLRLKRHLLTCADLEAGRTNRRARRRHAGPVAFLVCLCRPATLAA